jgi:MYXO-CTERM domain-containing protein
VSASKCQLHSTEQQVTALLLLSATCFAKAYHSEVLHHRARCCCYCGGSASGPVVLVLVLVLVLLLLLRRRQRPNSAGAVAASPVVLLRAQAAATADCSSPLRCNKQTRHLHAGLPQPTAQHSSEQKLFCGCSVVVQFESHAVMNLIISQSDVVFVNCVPLLDADLLRPRSCNMFLARYRAVQCSTSQFSAVQATSDADFLRTCSCKASSAQYKAIQGIQHKAVHF